MIRSHVIATMEIEFNAQYRNGEDGPIVTESGRTKKTLTGIFPSEDHARLWLDDYTEHHMNVVILSVKTVRPDACIIAHTW